MQQQQAIFLIISSFSSKLPSTRATTSRGEQMTDLCQAHPLSPRLGSRALPVPPCLPLTEIGLSQSQVTGARRLFLLLELLPHEGNDERATQLARYLLRLKNQAPRRLSRLAEDRLLLWHGPRLETCPTRARSRG